MINPKELRIGNYYHYKPSGLYQTIEPHDFAIIEAEERADDIESIPLTPEILEKCGFVDDDNDWLLEISERTCININFIKERYCLESYDGILNIIPIKSLHQLQNLYFSLTNAELTYTK